MGRPRSGTLMGLTVSLSDMSASDWHRLRPRVPSEYAFMSGVWYEAWSSHHLPSGSWRGPVVRAVVRDEKQNVVGVFPYAIQTKGPLKFMRSEERRVGKEC